MGVSFVPCAIYDGLTYRGILRGTSAHFQWLCSTAGHHQQPQHWPGYDSLSISCGMCLSWIPACAACSCVMQQQAANAHDQGSSSSNSCGILPPSRTTASVAAWPAGSCLLDYVTTVVVDVCGPAWYTTTATTLALFCVCSHILLCNPID